VTVELTLVGTPHMEHSRNIRPYRLVGDVEPPLDEQFLDVAIAQREATTTKTGLTVRCELDTGQYPSSAPSWRAIWQRT
jgi:hypothetical protein